VSLCISSSLISAFPLQDCNSPGNILDLLYASASLSPRGTEARARSISSGPFTPTSPSPLSMTFPSQDVPSSTTNSNARAKSHSQLSLSSLKPPLFPPASTHSRRHSRLHSQNLSVFILHLLTDRLKNSSNRSAMNEFGMVSSKTCTTTREALLTRMTPGYCTRARLRCMLGVTRHVTPA